MDVHVGVAVCRLVRVAVSFAVNFNRHEEQAPVAHSALGDHVIAELLHISGTSLEDGDLHATIVIEMNVKCRKGHFVMLVERMHEPLGQISRLVVIDVD
jgi:hypothetical protein